MPENRGRYRLDFRAGRRRISSGPSRVFHFGTLSLTEEPAAGATRRAVAFARNQGAFITCDPNLRLPLWDSPERARRAMEWAVQQADGVKVSGEEGRFLFGTGPEETVRRILESGARLVFVTLGADGCLACTSRERVSVPGFPVEPVDTTGAGDIFFGTAVWRWLVEEKTPEELTQKQLEEVARFACAAAALSVTRPGACPLFRNGRMWRRFCAGTHREMENPRGALFGRRPGDRMWPPGRPRDIKRRREFPSAAAPF